MIHEKILFTATGGRLKFAPAYPNLYRVGMSNLGLHIIYKLLNLRAGVTELVMRIVAAISSRLIREGLCFLNLLSFGSERK